MLWLRKMGAARSAAFHNVHDAAILWFTRDPQQVDATLVRQGAVTQISTTDEESIERARVVAEKSPAWVQVTSEAKWRKFVHLDRVTDVVLENDGGTRKLILSITYIAPDNPYAPQSYVCGEVHERNVIEYVLHRIGHKPDEHEEVVVVLEPTRAPKAKKKARSA